MNLAALELLDNLMVGPQSPGSHDRLSAFIDWAETYACEASDFWTGLHRTWSDCDDTWDQRDSLLELARLHGEFLEGHPCHFLQEECDRDFYASLPDRITIYRGSDMDRVMGLAWTTDASIAMGFAKGHRGIGVPNPVLASAFVRKRTILGAYQERQEQEVIVDPARHLSNLRVRFL